MKNMVISVMALTALASFAQAQVGAESSAHLNFKGVPIDGTLREYTLKMEKKGFTLVDTEDGASLLEGDFASYKHCMIGVATLKQKNLVSKITVMFPESDTWSSLSSNYYSLQEMLTAKYGQPSGYVETFEGPAPGDDNSRMHEVKSDRCKYYTTYETEKGTIQLSIEHNGASSCFVLLTYHDKINRDIIRAKAMDDL